MKNRYEIKTISDMWKIPEDKMDNFLKDLANFFSITREFKKTADLIGEKISQGKHKEAMQLPDSFIWIDDNEHKASINIKTKVYT